MVFFYLRFLERLIASMAPAMMAKRHPAMVETKIMKSRFMVKIFYFKNGVLAILSFAFFSSSSWCSTSSKLPQMTTTKRRPVNARIFFMACEA